MKNEELRAEHRAAVLSCIRTGKELANTHRWIAMHTRINERLVRNLIEELRNEGHLICNLQDGNGYFLAENEEDIEQQYLQDYARAMSILKRMKPFRHALREAETADLDQVTMTDLLKEVLTDGEG